MNKFRNDYLLENEEYWNNLNNGLSCLNQYSKELFTLGIDIKNKPWYKNLMEIYIPKAIEYYNNCKNIDFDINNTNEIWIRCEYKGFLSDVEKFTKFFIKNIFKQDKNINFFRAINELDNFVLKYKKLFNNKTWEDEVLNIKENLHRWRKNYNENKHDEEKIDDNFYIEDRIGFCIGDDILEYVSDFIYRIVCPLLASLLVIVRN